MTMKTPLVQFLNWDTVSRRRIDLIGRKDRGDQVVVHEFDFAKERQVVYEHKVRVQCRQTEESLSSCCYVYLRQAHACGNTSPLRQQRQWQST